MSNFFYNADSELETLVPGKNYRKVLAHSENLMIVEVYFEDGFDALEHKHVHEQASYCAEGEFEFRIGGEVKVIKEGDTVYMPSNVMHSCKVLTPKGKLVDVFTPQREDFLK